jgi:hypothetical protein
MGTVAPPQVIERALRVRSFSPLFLCRWRPKADVPLALVVTCSARDSVSLFSALVIPYPAHPTGHQSGRPACGYPPLYPSFSSLFVSGDFPIVYPCSHPVLFYPPRRLQFTEDHQGRSSSFFYFPPIITRLVTGARFSSYTITRQNEFPIVALQERKESLVLAVRCLHLFLLGHRDYLPLPRLVPRHKCSARKPLILGGTCERVLRSRLPWGGAVGSRCTG